MTNNAASAPALVASFACESALTSRRIDAHLRRQLRDELSRRPMNVTSAPERNLSLVGREEGRSGSRVALFPPGTMTLKESVTYKAPR